MDIWRRVDCVPDEEACDEDAKRQFLQHRAQVSLRALKRRLHHPQRGVVAGRQTASGGVWLLGVHRPQRNERVVIAFRGAPQEQFLEHPLGLLRRGHVHSVVRPARQLEQGTAPDGDRVLLTHYCEAKNHPRLQATGSTPPALFTFVDATNLLWRVPRASCVLRANDRHVDASPGVTAFIYDLPPWPG